MNEERQVFRNTLVLTLASLIDRASAVFLVFVLSQTLHVAGLGVYSVAIAFYGVLAMAAEVGASNFLVREIAKDKSKTGRYVVHLSIIGILVGILVVALAAVVIPHLGYSAELRTCVYVVLLAIIPGTLNALHEAVFVAHQRVEFQTYTALTVALLSLTTTLYLLTHGHGVVSVVAVFVITKYIITICYFFFTTRYITSLKERFDWTFARSLLYEIRAFAASSLLAGFFARPEILLLSLLTNETQAGFYSAALKLVDLWNILPETYMTNVFPVLSRSYHLADQKSQLIQDRSVKYLLALGLPITIGMTVAAASIVKMCYGADFSQTVIILQILAWNLPFSCLNSVQWRILVARGQQGSNVRAQTITFASRLLAGYLLISTWGAVGAAVTTLSNLLLHNRLLSFYIKQSGTRLSPLRLTWRFAVIAFVMGLVVAVFHDNLPLGVLVPLAAVVYVTLVVMLRAFSADDIVLFRQVLQSRASGGVS